MNWCSYYQISFPILHKRLCTSILIRDFNYAIGVSKPLFHPQFECSPKMSKIEYHFITFCDIVSSQNPFTNPEACTRLESQPSFLSDKCDKRMISQMCQISRSRLTAILIAILLLECSQLFSLPSHHRTSFLYIYIYIYLKHRYSWISGLIKHPLNSVSASPTAHSNN
jgi:hypothetical protein